MADRVLPDLAHRGLLQAARLYVGNADAELDVFHTSLGEVAVSTIADGQKSGPNEDSAAIVPVAEDHLVLVVPYSPASHHATSTASFAATWIWCAPMTWSMPSA